MTTSFHFANRPSVFTPTCLFLYLCQLMSDYSPSWKQFILGKYRSNTYGFGFRALARTFKVKGGARTVSDWYHAWDGTEESLQRKKGQGRKRKLSDEEVKQYILEPIRKKNRNSQPVQYRDVLAPLQEGTGKNVSLRTVQRAGKENACINVKRTQKKEKWEGKSHTHPSTYPKHVFVPSGSTHLCYLLTIVFC